MARITGLKERQIALTQIESKIKSLKPLNQFLNTQNKTNEYSVSFEKTKATIYCDNKQFIDELVVAYKNRIVNEIIQLSEQHSIALDEDDKKIMNEVFVPEVKRKEKEE